MKYYAQMFYEYWNCEQELDEPQIIDKEEFNQEAVNEWLDIYFRDCEVKEEEKEYYGFILWDDEFNRIDKLFYKK